MINQCGRCITLLSDTDISFGLFNLFTIIYIYMNLSDSKFQYKDKRNLKIY
jgi:hypothetical protein